MILRFHIFLLAAVLVFGAPLIALAHSQPIWQPFWGPILSCTGNYGSEGERPVVETEAVKEICRSICDILHTFQHSVYFVITVAVFAAAPVGVAIGGGMIMVARGSTEAVSQGRKVITAVVVGLVIVLGGYLIVTTFIYVLNLATTLGGGDNRAVYWGSIVCDGRNNNLAPDEADTRAFPSPTDLPPRSTPGDGLPPGEGL